jgi:murein DD-endopeptidase MepM/ murein hydrolase activator NlpD
VSATETTNPLPEIADPHAGATGRRRKPGPVVETPAAALERPAGRRRKSPDAPLDTAPRLDEAPLAELPELQGVQARPETNRRIAAPTAVVVEPPAASQAASLEVAALEVAALEVAAFELVESPGDLEPARAERASHPKAPPSRRATGARVSAVDTRPAAGPRRKPKKALLPGLPGSPAMVAGAAAVAVATAGVVSIADNGTSADAAAENVAQASAIEVAPSSRAQVEREVLTADVQARERAVRACRQRARAALAERKLVATQQQKKEELARKALEAAHARVVRLAQLAKLFSLPVKGYHLTAGFGDGGLWSHRHTGLDFACPWGTAIRAVAAGEVVSAKWDGAYGWKTVIRLPDGTENWYAHQSAFVVRSGHVEAGQIIGRVGSTGHTTGPHLHFEVRINDIPVNPKPWLQAHGLRP